MAIALHRMQTQIIRLIGSQYQREHVQQGTFTTTAVSDQRNVLLGMDLNPGHQQAETDTIDEAFLADVLQRVDDRHNRQGSSSRATGNTELPLTEPPPGVTHRSV